MQDIVLVILSACLTSYLTAKFMKNNDDKKREADIANNRQALMKALYSELVNFRDIYVPIELSPDLPFNGNEIAISYISQKYVTVYESQLNILGLLDKDDIPYIIRLYINIKALIDSRIRLNDIREEHIQYTKKMIADPSKSPYGNMLDAYKIALKYQEEVYKLYPKVIECLEKYDKNNEAQN